MTLKRKIALNISIAFSLLFGIVMLVIYISFNDFRKDEFRQRFQKRLVYTLNFINKSKNFEEEAPLFFDENSDYILLNEQIMIFNSDKTLIYSTIKDTKVRWDDYLLEKLDQTPTIYNEDLVPEVYAALRKIRGQNYYILTSAQDKSGQAKLAYLKYLLVFAFIMSLVLIWFFSYYITSRFLLPLEVLQKEISERTIHNLTSPIIAKNSNDEISVLAHSFNTLSTRLNDVFQSQKDFTASASHEIRTPLTRMAFQLENLVQLGKHEPQTQLALKQMLLDVYQLSDLTQSLILLTQFDKQQIQLIFEEVRIDEIIFASFARVEKNLPQFKMSFNIDENSHEDSLLMIHGIASLLEIVFHNLFKNAALYSHKPEVQVTLLENKTHIFVEVLSVGNTLSAKEQLHLFEAFSRGVNAKKTLGSGLGLLIVKRIMSYHKAQISYSIPAKFHHLFRLEFSKNS